MSKVLIVEDIQENREMLAELLRSNGHEVMIACHGQEALELAAETTPDLVISDILMPVMDGFALCRRWVSDPVLRHRPFVFYSATYTDAQDLDLALGLGAARFLVKPAEPARFLATIDQVMKEYSDQVLPPREKQAKEEDVYLREYNEALIRKLEKKMLELAQSNGALRDEIAHNERATHVIEDYARTQSVFIELLRIPLKDNSFEQMVNTALETVLGSRQIDAAQGACIWLADEPDGELALCAQTGRIPPCPDGLPAIQEGRWPCGDKVDEAPRRGLATRFHACTGNPTDDGQQASYYCVGFRGRDEIPGVLCLFIEGRHEPVDRDREFLEAIGDLLSSIIEHRRSEETRKALEEQLRQAQRLEAVGRLAGGVAHDFNNLLSTIMCSVDLTMQDLRPEDPSRGSITLISEVTRRAATLTRQLLTFSRKELIEPRKVSLNELLVNMNKMLVRTIGENYIVDVQLDDPIPAVLVDPGQVENIVINLVVNACDAMPQGGHLTLRTEVRQVAESDLLRVNGSIPGTYVVLSVADRGTGIAPENLSQIFEPFYTTKPAGKGTGLGLSMVYGAMKQNNGFVDLESALEAGTSFHCYFPAIEDPAAELPARQEAGAPPTGQGTILLVEDEPLLQEVTETLLIHLGYTVVVAGNATEALAASSKLDTAPELVLTDVIMPGMNGIDLVEKLRVTFPGIPALFVSGHSEEAQLAAGREFDTTNFLAKPFGIDKLAQSVARVLQKPRRNGGNGGNRGGM